MLADSQPEVGTVEGAATLLLQPAETGDATQNHGTDMAGASGFSRETKHLDS